MIRRAETILPLNGILRSYGSPSGHSGSFHTSTIKRAATTAISQQSKKEGDISSVFASLSGSEAEQLPQRFAAIKQKLSHGREEALKNGWDRLLSALRREVEIVKESGRAIIPELSFDDIDNAPEQFKKGFKKRGVAVIRGVVPEEEALGYKADVQKYIQNNPTTKGTFQHMFRKLYELYPG